MSNYGEDAAPKLPPTPSEIMEALLKDGPHLAFVDDISEGFARKDRHINLIVRKKEGPLKWLGEFGEAWRHVIPCDSRGNEITELPEVADD